MQRTLALHCPEEVGRDGIANRAARSYIAAMPDPSSTENQRTIRTRALILRAFVGLVLERRYETIRITDLVAAAGVGKATFYEHFHGKNDVLLTAMHPVLLALSTAASGRAARGYVKETISHLWDNRATARTILNSTAAPHVERKLAGLIRLQIKRTGSADIAPSIRAAGVAAAQLAMLRRWLSGEARCAADEITDRMIDCSRLIA